VTFHEAKAGLEARGAADGWRLLAAILGLPLVEVASRAREELPPAAQARVASVGLRLSWGWPEAYALGRAGFWQREVAVGPGVLIPRPDTEALVRLATTALPKGGVFAELGTGSGAVALALLDARPDARGFASDLSAEALRLARRNVEAAGQGSRLALYLGDLVRPLAARRLRVDLLVMNPPYVGRAERVDRALGAEPELALFAAADGWNVLHRLIAVAPTVLLRHGALIVEVGRGQAEGIEAWCRQAQVPMVVAGSERDLGGIRRALLLRPKVV
jgi:release factor glutamine methyltransferase